MMSSYQTLAGEGHGEIVIQKSRFLADALPVATEADAQAFLQRIRNASRDASHHCFAYTIGSNMGIMRYSDDGEPSGTAGLPMMEVVKQKAVCNCCVVVTRYFGGILLGAAGLLRAYTQSCALGIAQAGIVTMEPTVSLLCEIAYPLWDSLQHAMKTAPVQIRHIEYAASISFSLLVREKDRTDIENQLTQLTQGQIFCLEESTSFQAWPV